MKHAGYLFCLLFFSLSLFAQKGNVVYALRLTDGEMSKLPTSVYQSFSVEDDNVIRANKGWEIFIDDRAQAFVFRPVNTKYEVESAATPQFSERKDGPFRDFCFCGPGDGGNCKHTQESRGDEDIVRCEGNCACNSFTIFEPDESPPQVQGPGMNWYDFNGWRK
jgi:hypothetical protein